MNEFIPKILVISDNQQIQQKIYENLVPFNLEITRESSILRILSQTILAEYDLVIATADSTQELLSFARLCQIQKNRKLFIITDLEKKIMDKYSFDCFMHTAFDEADLILEVNRLLADFHQKAKTRLLQKNLHSKRILMDVTKPVTQDSRIFNQVKNAERFAAQRNNVFITGPVGSGKTLFADFIFKCSPIKEKQYLYINCRQFSEPQIKDLIFENSAGGQFYNDYLNSKFRGVVYLDNVTSLSLEMQSKLSDRLEELFRNQENRNIQIISTSTYSREETLKEFLLLPNLMKFLCEDILQLPPLSKRKTDILVLFDYFQQSFEKEFGLNYRTLSKNFEYLLTTYEWPENVTQLKDAARKFCFFGEHISEKEFKKLIESTSLKEKPINFLTEKTDYTPHFLQQNLK
ncbi:MAG: sigma 54-interacting transcriptional regulator [Candidatus Marinimicrobia bacterium]|nr:sigma 54-interacting transcriptional regulator [Candidatus Neomarinimicrobiota bacterium]